MTPAFYNDQFIGTEISLSEARRFHLYLKQKLQCMYQHDNTLNINSRVKITFRLHRLSKTKSKLHSKANASTDFGNLIMNKFITS